MLKKFIAVVVLIFILMQFIPLEKTNPKVDENIALHADKKVMDILKRSCYDCHSDETKWSIYSDIAPGQLRYTVLSWCLLARFVADIVYEISLSICES